MNKSTPIAKGVRTFVQVLAASAIAWTTLDLSGNFNASATIIGLNTFAALLAGAAAFLMAFTPITGTNAITKAVFTFLQALGAWLATAGLGELTVDAVKDFGAQFWQAAVAAAIAAVVTLINNVAEDRPVS